ncbi:hypothetical protein BCR35DRAFT_298636 [Leucosporidium creatinivorum]|uniref:NADH dehydrogenase [ubiquinone] 1 beta subcomplex subunit 4 n=1 Tax=Leucosporidium creatinivorum TaxID=106004 RepID=A0A1Y2G3F2_9BASI|nr:hypothetical protein BCR35DRAFT_298636 [Leucosporidium creatinivorum]
MGGHGGYQPVKLDPGVESWNYMRENVWKHFRFTNKTARLSLLWGVLVPIGVYSICQQQDLKWDILGAKRDSPLARWGTYAVPPSERNAPAADADEE